jgi:hypothetical protein
MTYKVKISDSYCEWEFALYGSNEYSIRDLRDAILEKTGLVSDNGTLIKDNATLTKERELLSMYKYLVKEKDKQIKDLLRINEVNQYTIDFLKEL